MLVDSTIGSDLKEAAAAARKAEDAGYDGVWAAETGSDPMLGLTLAAEHTERVTLGTAIVVAFGRSPMTVANQAWGLNAFSSGRFVVGLGSQIKAHIVRRYSMPWSHPAPRMREFILAMRAIWDCWQNGTPLDFRGEFYTHTLMTPFFNPGPNEFGAPKVFLAAVGEHMTKVAAEVADGLLVHGFTTERYLKEVTLPAVKATLAANGRSREDFQLSYPAFVVTGDNEAEVAAAEAGTRRQIAFYGSTPAYRPVLDLHGWGELQPELNVLSKQGRWEEMGKLIDDEVLDAFAVRGTPEEVPALLRDRFGGVVDRISLYMPYRSADVASRILAGLREGRAG
ncbi:MAG TPA: LLM class F420-dependent oxidoreductase [Acidimicrobiales bacterium]|nr:LLM class F420-dependent oxidoreductase [Acidimicrobiales bacterium]